MSRTKRAVPYRCLRHPRGKVQAIIRGDRPKAIPPDAYDDIPVSDEARKAIRNLIRTHAARSDARLAREATSMAHISYPRALQLVRDLRTFHQRR